MPNKLQMHMFVNMLHEYVSGPVNGKHFDVKAA